MHPASPSTLTVFNELDPDYLRNGIQTLVKTYQRTRSGMVAWFVVHYAQALCHHPELDGGDEERCEWQRLSRQWKSLAEAPHCASCASRAVA